MMFHRFQSSAYLHLLALISTVLLLLATVVWSPSAQAESMFSSIASDPVDDGPTFLDVNEAFIFSYDANGQTVHLYWSIADTYMLYRDKFRFSTETAGAELGEAVFERDGVIKNDPIFGEVEVFLKPIRVDIPVTKVPADGLVELKIRSQGCAEGFCYPPQTKRISVQLAPSPVVDNNASTENPDHSDRQNDSQQASNQNSGNKKIDTDSFQGIQQLMEESSFGFILIAFFGFGLALTFTPCVLPMVPILSGIIIGQDQQNISGRKGFILSSSYVLGMALTFALLGVAAAASGKALQTSLQDASVLYTVAGLFVLLSLSMFGFYELQLPAPIRDRLTNLNQQQQGGSLIGVFIMGVLSALVVSPCVTAPLAGALAYISTTGDMVVGGFALLLLGLGMGAPLIFIGTTGANILPKAGMWMDTVKAIFGILLLGVALWLVKHLLPDIILWSLAALLLIMTGIYLGALETATSSTQKLIRSIALTSLLAGAGLLIGNGLKLAGVTQSEAVATVDTNAFVPVYTIDALNQKLSEAKEQRKPVMVDYYAKWCTYCVTMEKTVFNREDVLDALSHMTVLKVDLYDGNPDAGALQKRFQLTTPPPAFIFLDKDGNEINSARIMGKKNAQEFLDHLKTHNLVPI